MKSAIQQHFFSPYNESPTLLPNEQEVQFMLKKQLNNKQLHRLPAKVLSQMNVTQKTEVNATSTPFTQRHLFYPYHGCKHGCMYCFARFSPQFSSLNNSLHLENGFGIQPKTHLLLEHFFHHPKWIPIPISLSGDTNCFEPLQSKMPITRQLLQVCLKYKNPISISTENGRILQHIQLLKELAKQQLVKVSIPICSLNSQLSQVLQPRTTSTKNRLKIIEQLSKNAIPVQVIVSPFVAGLTDVELPALLKAAAQHGAIAAGIAFVLLSDQVKENLAIYLHQIMPSKAAFILQQLSENQNELEKERKNTQINGLAANHLLQIVDKAFEKHFPLQQFQLQTAAFHLHGQQRLAL